MKNLISGTAIKTFLAVIIVLALTYVGVSFWLPGPMASLYEDMGSYSIAVRYASLAYTYSGGQEDLARCVDDSILADSNADVIRFAEQLVEREDFEDYCLRRDQEMNYKLEAAGIEYGEYSYRQFVIGNLACAYFSEGDAGKAVEWADSGMRGVEGFPANNAYAMLASRAVTAGDGQTCQTLLEHVRQIAPLPAQQEYYSSVLSLLQG